MLALWLVAAMTAGAAAADEKKPVAVWSDQAELSFVNTTGNTRATTLAGKNVLSHVFSPKLKGSWKLGALYGEEDGRKAAERYETELRADHLLTERNYAYALAGWNRDRFAGIDQRYYGGAGLGRNVLVGPKHFLSAEAGLNGTREEYIDGSSSDFLTGRAFAKYEYAFTAKSRFTQSLEFLYDFSDASHYKGNSETAVVASLADIFSVKAAYTVRYDHKPVPADLKRTDTLMSVALVANF
jgi:putative salt-induced outer membrane protein